MKRVKIAFVILLSAAALTWWSTSRVGSILDGFKGHLDAVDEALISGVGLEEACRAAEEYWLSHENELIRTIPQYRVDDVCSTTVRLVPLSSSDEVTSEFKAELSLLRHKIDELWEAHSPSWSSLF